MEKPNFVKIYDLLTTEQKDCIATSYAVFKEKNPDSHLTILKLTELPTINKEELDLHFINDLIQFFSSVEYELNQCIKKNKVVK